MIDFVWARVTHLLAIHYDCWNQNYRSHFSLTRIQNYAQAPSGSEHLPTFAPVYVRAEAKKIKPFASLKLFKRLVCLLLKVDMSNAVDMIVGLAY